MTGHATIDTMTLARHERADLAEFLATPTAEQWDAPTLCDRWRVREVVAHVDSYEDLGFGRLAARLIRSGLDIDRVNARGVADHAGRIPEQDARRRDAHPRAARPRGARPRGARSRRARPRGDAADRPDCEPHFGEPDPDCEPAPPAGR